MSIVHNFDTSHPKFAPIIQYVHRINDKGTSCDYTGLFNNILQCRGLSVRVKKKTCSMYVLLKRIGIGKERLSSSITLIVHGLSSVKLYWVENNQCCDKLI